MNESSAHSIRFTVINLEGEECLFTESRVKANTIPLPFLKYEVRHADEYDGAYIAETVDECFLGTVITQRLIDFNRGDALTLDEGEVDFYSGCETSLAAFVREHGIDTKPRSGRSTRSIGLTEYADDFAGDSKYGYHLSFDGSRLMRDDETIYGAYEKRLQTDQFTYFSRDDECVMFSTTPDGAVGEMISNNSFAETGFLDSMEAVLTRTGKERVLFMDDDGTRPYLNDFIRNYEWDVKGQDATKLTYYDVETQGTRALYTELTVASETVPKALHVYEVDSDPANPDGKLKLSKRAYVNFQGTLITERPLDLGADDAIYLDPKDVSLHSDAPIKLKDFARECGVRVKPPKDRER